MLAFAPLAPSEIQGGECYLWRLPLYEAVTTVALRMSAGGTRVDAVLEPGEDCWRTPDHDELPYSVKWLTENGEWSHALPTPRHAEQQLGRITANA